MIEKIMIKLQNTSLAFRDIFIFFHPFLVIGPIHIHLIHGFDEGKSVLLDVRTQQELKFSTYPD